MHLLKEGQQSEYNMVELRTHDEYHEFRTLWKALANPGSVSILLTGPATEEGLKTQKTVTRGKLGPQVESVSLLRFGDHQKCPWIKTDHAGPQRQDSCRCQEHGAYYGTGKLSKSFFGKC